MKNTISVLCLIALAAGANAQEKSAKGKTKKDSKVESAGSFVKTPTGLEYKIYKDAPGGTNPAIGDYVEVHVTTSVNDSVLFDTRKMNNNQPVQFPVTAPAYKGDLAEGLMLLTAGDSAVFMLSVDTLQKAGVPAQPWMKPGTNQKLKYTIALVSVKTTDQMKKEQDANAAKQTGIDEQLLQDYFKKNNITASKTASGLYYKIDKKGAGENAKSGQKVTVNYTGQLMDGTKFDSNVDPQFQHVEPFSFTLGQGQVIKGWDEGISLLNKGSKGTLYIPSTLAYGANGQGPIKPNSILIFEVELVDAQ